MFTPLNFQPSDDGEEEDPMDTDVVPGISMHGAIAPRQPPYHGPAFPPQQPPPRLPDTTTLPSSDQLAAGIRRRELLQNRAVDW